MAVPKKRRCVEPQEQSTDSEDYNSDDENNQENESMVRKKRPISEKVNNVIVIHFKFK